MEYTSGKLHKVGEVKDGVLQKKEFEVSLSPSAVKKEIYQYII